jgi:hypothetical protein
MLGKQVLRVCLASKFWAASFVYVSNDADSTIKDKDEDKDMR